MIYLEDYRRREMPRPPKPEPPPLRLVREGPGPVARVTIVAFLVAAWLALAAVLSLAWESVA